MTQFELTFTVKNLSQNLSSSCLCCSFELSSRSSLSNLNFERNAQIRCSRNRPQFDIQICTFSIETSWFILLRERASMARIVGEACTKALFAMNYASLKLEACIHRWTSSEACRAVNLLLLGGWTQVSISKYLVEQSLKSLARNVTPSRGHLDQHGSQHGEQPGEQPGSRGLAILAQVGLDSSKLAQILPSWPKFLQVGPNSSKLAREAWPFWPKLA